MPSPLTHLLVGRSALAWLRPEELPQYCLGCVVPDAPNLDGFASKEIRWSAHLRDKEPDQWVENAAQLVAACAPCQRSLLLGYAVHVVADAVWDEHFEAGLRKALDAKKLSHEECFRQRWNEHHRFEQEQLRTDWWSKEARPLLIKAEPQAVNGLSAELVARYRVYLLEEYAPHPDGKTVGYVTSALVEEFGSRVAKRLQRAGIR